jgi:hypothetical protein
MNKLEYVQSMHDLQIEIQKLQDGLYHKHEIISANFEPRWKGRRTDEKIQDFRRLQLAVDVEFLDKIRAMIDEWFAHNAGWKD